MVGVRGDPPADAQLVAWAIVNVHRVEYYREDSMEVSIRRLGGHWILPLETTDTTGEYLKA